MTCCYNSSAPLTNKHHHIYVFTYLFVFIFFVFLQRKVNSTGRCASIVMQLFTVELACLITSGHMQNEKELPYLREPVSAISNTHNKTPTSRAQQQSRVYILLQVVFLIVSFYILIFKKKNNKYTTQRQQDISVIYLLRRSLHHQSLCPFYSQGSGFYSFYWFYINSQNTSKSI